MDDPRNKLIGLAFICFPMVIQWCKFFAFGGMIPGSADVTLSEMLGASP